VAVDDVVVHALAAEVQVAVLEAEEFLDVLFFGDVEGRGAGSVQDLKGRGVDFDAAGGQVRVLGAGLAEGDNAFSTDDVLAAEVFGLLEGVRGFLGAEDDLTMPVESRRSMKMRPP
jgi:hypothetical protein